MWDNFRGVETIGWPAVLMEERAELAAWERACFPRMCWDKGCMNISYGSLGRKSLESL